MNKKKILTLTLAILITLPVTAYAKGNNVYQGNNSKQQQVTQSNKIQNQNSGIAKGNENKQEAQQNKDQKKEQINTFKTQIKDKHNQMKALREQTIALKQEIEQKKDQLTSVINDLQSGKKTLPEDMLNSLLDMAQNLNTDGEGLKKTAEINNEVADTQAKVKSGDFNNALTALDGVIAKYQTRLDALKKLNSDLDTALAIANLATTPAPATTSSTSTSQ